MNYIDDYQPKTAKSAHAKKFDTFDYRSNPIKTKQFTLDNNNEISRPDQKFMDKSDQDVNIIHRQKSKSQKHRGKTFVAPPKASTQKAMTPKAARQKQPDWNVNNATIGKVLLTSSNVDTQKILTRSAVNQKQPDWNVSSVSKRNSEIVQKPQKWNVMANKKRDTDRLGSMSERFLGKDKVNPNHLPVEIIVDQEPDMRIKTFYLGDKKHEITSQDVKQNTKKKSKTNILTNTRVIKPEPKKELRKTADPKTCINKPKTAFDPKSQPQQKQQSLADSKVTVETIDPKKTVQVPKRSVKKIDKNQSKKPYYCESPTKQQDKCNYQNFLKNF